MVTSDIRYSCGLADEMGANAFPHFDHLELISQLEQMPRVLVCVSDRLRDNHTVTFTVSPEWKRNTGFRLLLRQLRHRDGQKFHLRTSAAISASCRFGHLMHFGLISGLPSLQRSIAANQFHVSK